MYIPGRSRTGSRPSSTWMSLAVYDSRSIEKALLTGRFLLPVSLPEGPVVRSPREGRRGGPRHQLAELGILDRARDSAAFCSSGLVHDGSLRRRCFSTLDTRLRQRADREAETRGRRGAELAPQPFAD